MGFKNDGDVVVLLGVSNIQGEASNLSGSEYLELIHRIVAGQPKIDLDKEVAVQRTVRRLISQGIAKSAHDCSDGGLAVALAEACIAGGTGFRGEFEVSGRWDAALFGEEQSRIIVSLPADELSELKRICGEEGVEWMKLGEVGGDSISMPDLIDVSVAASEETWRNSLERALNESEAV